MLCDCVYVRVHGCECVTVYIWESVYGCVCINACTCQYVCMCICIGVCLCVHLPLCSWSGSGQCNLLKGVNGKSLPQVAFPLDWALGGMGTSRFHGGMVCSPPLAP